MRTLVFLEETCDAQVGIEQSERTGYPLLDWQVRQLDEASLAALALALSLDHPADQGQCMVVTLGDTSVERYLRLALAWGAQRVQRVWDPGLLELGSAARALIYAAVATTLEFDLVLVGESDAEDLAGTAVLTAELLGIPCVRAVQTLERFAEGPASEARAFQLTRTLEGGFGERLAARAPALVSVRPTSAAVATPTLDALLAASAAEISVVGLAELGVPREALRELEGRLSFGALRPPRPPVLPLAAPDSALPAFDRIQGLIRGTVAAREGRLVHGTAEDLAEALFERLRGGGWLAPTQAVGLG